MSPVVISLTSLVFFFIQRIWAQVGIYRKPSLLAQPGPLVKSGRNVTLHCCSEIVFESFILQREGVSKDTLYLAGQRHLGGSYANFSMGPVTAAHAGTYRCFGSLNHSSHEWSAPSGPLDIMITGLHQKPLWAQPGTVMRSGENVTLSCCSESSFDVYHLSRDGQPHELWLAKGQRHGGASWADFTLGPAHPALGGTYRCYGSFNPSPCEWSGPSDPLYLSVTDAAIMNREPEVDRMVSREDPQAEDPQEVIYTQLDHCIFMQEKTIPTSWRPKEPLHDDGVYMELATC
ncbi:killer cell immunoglobulin-like receptor 2DL3 isoform X5 [Callorhinus ursinus]|uniref:killer cell immunoglobulin-like receptor 2DL3 isoform X5 n=1 Tax=Callorhinus ursinus TaxID=34884 RepID=UPI003CD03729